VDKIAYWSEIKLDIIKDYAKPYSTILSNQPWCTGHYYIDAFAGAGEHFSKTSNKMIPGSPLNALQTRPPFTHYYLIDLDSGKTDHLRKFTRDYTNVSVFDGDCNSILLSDVFPVLQNDKFCRALCVLDPYGLHLDWKVIQAAGDCGRTEIFLNFPVADMNRNALWKDSEKADSEQVARLTAFWGDESWREAAYERDLFGLPAKSYSSNVVKAFKKRLVEVAGFKYVPEPVPMRIGTNAILYYLFFASPNATANKIVKDIFKKHRKILE
jgi:three-Cys-motif partner protein